LITQTGGGCRASNYKFLLKKALKAAGYDYVPILTFNFSELHKLPEIGINTVIYSKFYKQSFMETY
jgi:predicted nucleotide-binding protein (sugar kinase/HSP70/actin superfamily)